MSSLSADFAISDAILFSQNECFIQARCDLLWIFNLENDLHGAVKLGQVDFVNAILEKQPGLAKTFDNNGCTPLHLACWSANLKIVRQLINSDSTLCCLKDKHGRTPLHIAAIRGRLSIMKELLDAWPSSVMDVTSSGETALHLAIIHDQVKGARLLLDWLSNKNVAPDTINMKDCRGNTALHLATSRKQLQTLKLLLRNCTKGNMVQVNAINFGGFTALDILDVLPQGGKIDLEIEKILRKAGAVRAKDVIQTTRRPLRSIYNGHHTLLVTTALLITITFLAALRPPAFVLGRGYIGNGNSMLNSALITGEGSPLLTHLFIWFNSVAFFASVAMAALLTRELALRPWFLVLLFSIVCAYTCLILALIPSQVMALIFLTDTFLLLAAATKNNAMHKKLVTS